MIVVIIVLVVSGAVFSLINLALARTSGEQTKLDLFQEAREFMDQMSLDLRQAGYPSPRNMDPSLLAQNPIINDLSAAAGVVKVGDGDLWFEGDVDGSGQVSVVRYHLDNTGVGCPCLKRSQLPKVDGDPLAGQTTEEYQVEVQGVLNSTVFTAYSNGALVSPVDITTSGGQTLAKVDTIQAVLTLQSTSIDAQTRRQPVVTLITTVRLNNCSQAAIGFKTSCQ